MGAPLGEGEIVVIIGGGIVGVSTAYHLSLRGIKPLVLERSAVAAAASGKAGGFLAGGWGNGYTVSMHEISFEMHQQLAEELGLTSYRKIPTLQVSSGGRRRRSQVPWLDGQASGSMMDPDTAQVTPLELTTKLMEAAQAKGAELRIATVTGVSTTPLEGSAEEESTGEKQASSDQERQRRITGVLLEGGELIPCDRVIVAMGPWTCVAEDWFGIPIPMQGIKSTSMVLESSEAVANNPYALFCAEDQNGCHLEVYPRPTGEVYICGLGGSDHVSPSRMKPGGDCESAEKINPNLSRVEAAIKSFKGMSSLGNAAPTLSQACMRPCPPDGLPIMGEVPGVTGAYLAAGHNCWGILWGPVTGLVMAELVLDGKASSVDIRAFSPSRFMHRTENRGRKRGATNLVGEQW